jgi:hypothetical protein
MSIAAIIKTNMLSTHYSHSAQLLKHVKDMLLDIERQGITIALSSTKHYGKVKQNSSKERIW